MLHSLARHRYAATKNVSVLEATVQQIPDAECYRELSSCGCASFEADAILQELNKVLTSRTFQAAQGQRTFLQYTVEQAVLGCGHLLKEYVIGVEALRRGDTFDPRLDPIVRTQARKLRARLAKYYETEGQQDPIRIEFPKGSYVPIFLPSERNDTALTPEIQAPAAVLAPANELVPPQGSTTPHRFSVPSWRTAVASLVVASVLGVAAIAFYGSNNSGSIPTDEASLAVIPLVDLENTDGDEYLSDGLTDDLIASFRAVPKLRVIAHNSAFQFKNRERELLEIDRKLRVRMILVGTVHRSHERLQITVQLNSVPNGYHLWNGNYDRQATDLRSVESEIVRAVSGVLGTTLTDSANQEVVSMLSRPAVPNLGARDSYFRGLQSWHKLSPEGLQAATGFFKKAIAEDPSFARAYAALADCYVVAPQFASFRTSSSETAALIKKFALRALALDKTLGEAHFDLAISSEYEFDWSAAEKQFKEGFALSPGNAVGHLWYAKYLALTGRKAEVLSHRKTAAELDPVSAYAAQSVAGYFSVMGRYDAAIAQFRTALSLEPGFGLAHQGLGFTYLLAGRRADALAELQVADQLMAGPYREALLGYAYGVCGETEDARRILNGLLQQAREQPFPAVAVAHVYIGLGDKDRAFEWLEKAIDQRDLSVDLQWDPVYRTMRPDPRYTALLRRMKLS